MQIQKQHHLVLIKCANEVTKRYGNYPFNLPETADLHIYTAACLQQDGSSCDDAVTSAACRALVMSPLRMSDSGIPLGCVQYPNG